MGKVSADGTYNLGDTISLVVFDTAVTVTGTPQLARDQVPHYAAGELRERQRHLLQFDYEVVAGNEDTDGEAHGLTLNGGTIRRAATAASL